MLICLMSNNKNKCKRDNNSKIKQLEAPVCFSLLTGEEVPCTLVLSSLSLVVDSTTVIRFCLFVYVFKVSTSYSLINS